VPGKVCYAFRGLFVLDVKQHKHVRVERL
jgi:hypothetical protein